MDLKKLGITSYGELESGELGDCANNKLELFFPDRGNQVRQDIYSEFTLVIVANQTLCLA